MAPAARMPTPTTAAPPIAAALLTCKTPMNGGGLRVKQILLETFNHSIKTRTFLIDSWLWMVKVVVLEKVV